ncbi:MAG: DUF885 domain-containing protein [Elusimicrobia bacterium]|nr:DUF885 domain-containing protein [Elusimicrobiota bacterium]
MRSPRPASTESARALARLARDYWETKLRFNPLLATYYGHDGGHDRLEEHSEGGRREEIAAYEALLKGLTALPADDLSRSDSVSWRILKTLVEDRLSWFKHRFWSWQIDHMDGPQSWIPTVVRLRQPMASEADAESLLSRMRAFPGFFETQAANLREGLSAGYAAARMPVQKAIRQLDALIEAPASQSAFVEAALKLPDLPRRRHGPLIEEAVQSHVLPAYRGFRRFLEQELLPRARVGRVGIYATPGGAEAYRFMIRRHTTLDLEPAEIHDLGLSELRQIRQRMAELAGSMGHAGELEAFLNAIRSDPKNFFETREQVLSDAKAQVTRAKAELGRYFGRLPRVDVRVEPIESFKEKNDVAARYFDPPEDLSGPGIYYINTYQPSSRPRFGMAALAVHEAVPGHHLQMALALEQRSLPAFRRIEYFNAFTEGWALYAETLGEEMGLYPDELSRLGMLTYQAWRACRLVVDTGLHALGWERERALRFMEENNSLSREEIETEVDRYIIWPGQALSYMIGKIEILKLRKEAENALGGRFDIKAFHDAVLENGSMPLPLLREQVFRGLGLQSG